MLSILRSTTHLLLLTLLLAGAAGCAPAGPGPTTVVRETVVVVVTATQPGATDIPPTTTPSPLAATAQGTSTPQPSPTALALNNVPIEGGDPNNKFYVMLVYPKYQPAATTSLVFRVYAHKPSSSKVDGEGIDSVDFRFTNSNDVEVYSRQEKQAGYCAFTGGEPDCLVWVFAEHNNEWPNGNKIVSGTYTLNINATAKDQTVMFGKTTFRIQIP